MLLIALNMLNGYEEKKICFNGKKKISVHVCIMMI